MYTFIEIMGARENNLKNISLSIPKNKLVVFTGLSGSGKSTLALDTLQKECQRQYMESMGMVTDFISKPKIDAIIGLSPSISIDQRNNNHNPRSTVGTVTEVFTYLRILFAKLGVRKCPRCGELIRQPFEMEMETDYMQRDESLEDIIGNSDVDENMIACPSCGEKLPDLLMSHFSFNKPEGACPTCRGLGVVNTPDLERIINADLSISDGGVRIWDKFHIDRYSEAIENAGSFYGFPISIKEPLKNFGQIQMDYLLYGVLSPQFCRHFPGVKPDEPTTGLHPHDIKKLIALLNELVEHGNTVICVEHNLDVIAMSDWVVDFGPEGGDAGGEIIVQGTPETVAKTVRSQTGMCLRSILEAQNFTKGCFI